MITELKLQNFKAHEDLYLSFVEKRGEKEVPRQLTVLVGPNGAGKTTVLQALAVLGTAFDGKDRSLRGALSSWLLVRKGCSQGGVLARGLRRDSPWKLWTLFEYHDDGPPDQMLGGQLQNPAEGWGYDNGFSAPSDLPEFFSARLLSLNSRAVAEASYSDELFPELQEDGSLAPSVLANLKLEHDDVFQAVTEDLRALLPTLTRLRIRPHKVTKKFADHVESVTGHQILFDFVGASDVEAHAVSEGTLLMLAILIALHTSNTNLLLLDDIERSLHPTAQMELMRIIKKLLERKPELQIIATTHSPYILDELDPSQVIVFFPRKDGTIAHRSLSEHPNAQRAIGTLSAGQLWTLDPEDWVAEEAKEKAP